MDERGVGAETILSQDGGTEAPAVGPILDPGTVVAGYAIEGLAGRGGMGVVYRASDPELGRQVALKLIAPQRAGDPRFRELFVRESMIAAGLEQPALELLDRPHHHVAADHGDPVDDLVGDTLVASLEHPGLTVGPGILHGGSRAALSVLLRRLLHTAVGEAQRPHKRDEQGRGVER